MPIYTIEAQLTSDQVTTLYNDNYSICLAKIMNMTTIASEGPTPVSNVVAASYLPGEYGVTSLFQWEEIYGIAANSALYPEGEVIKHTQTAINSPFDLQSLFEVDNWAITKVIPKSGSVATDSFGFNPVKYDGIAVLYLVTREPASTTEYGSPCYTSPRLVPHGPESLEQITPSKLVQIFCERDAHSGSMKTHDTNYTTSFEFKDGMTDLIIHLDMEKGRWVEGPAESGK